MISGQSPVGDEGGAGDAEEEGGGGEAGSWTPGDAEGQWEWESFWNVKYCVYTGFNKTGCILTFTITITNCFPLSPLVTSPIKNLISFPCRH